MHLFIVSERTLPVHLSYAFAGVAKSDDFSWSHVEVNPQAERSQASLYADICRVHAGDELLFYLERPQHDLEREGGRFLGIFEVVSPFPFYEPGGAYLQQELGLPLVYRLLIRPKEIFQQGLTEWQAMDEMTDVRTIHDIPWTLIYRKMEGGRGCTPLLPHEAQVLRRMLDLRNAGQRVRAKQIAFDPDRLALISADPDSHYDPPITASSQQLRLLPPEPAREYTGDTSRCDHIDERLRYLIERTPRRWELHLQAYLMQELGRNAELTAALFPGVTLSWIGNEIYAGAGMQSIDILLFSHNDTNRFIHLLELKSLVADSEAAAQLNRYIKWLKAHIPDISVHQIIPTIVAPDVSRSFHHEMQIYLRGHGITQYRIVRIDGTLTFMQEICSGF